MQGAGAIDTRSAGLPSMQVRDSRKFVGVAHSISASGVVTDCKSCALTLFYTPEMLTGLEGGRFSIYYYNEQAGRWEDQGGVVYRETRSGAGQAVRHLCHRGRRLPYLPAHHRQVRRVKMDMKAALSLRMVRRILQVVMAPILGLAVALLLPTAARAEPGDLDPTFGRRQGRHRAGTAIGLGKRHDLASRR